MLDGVPVHFLQTEEKVDGLVGCADLFHSLDLFNLVESFMQVVLGVIQIIRDTQGGKAGVDKVSQTLLLLFETLFPMPFLK